MKNKKIDFCLENKISSDQNHYRVISERYKDAFFKLYNHKCVYCGLTKLPPVVNFEIDHFVGVVDGSKKNDKIENLVCSCQKCNRTKSNNSSFNDIDHPDLIPVSNYWMLNDKFETQIKYEYENNESIKNVYHDLSLNYSEQRMLNMYLILHSLNVERNLELNELLDKLLFILRFGLTRRYDCDG